MASIRRWWTSDTALHTYIYAQTLISLPFSVFGTYTQYQLQAVGYATGKDSVGGPCVDYCIVPWLGTHMDLNSVLLYMNAFGIGLSGLITLFLAAYSDYWSHKHLLVTIGFVTYGCFTIPVYWLQDTSSYDFNVLSALSIVFTIATNILVAVLNIYVPYCMRENAAAIKASTRSHGHPNVLPSPPSPPSSSNAPIGNASVESSEKRTYGFKMTVIGSFANSIGALIMYIIVIIITETTKNVNAPGLLVATTVGFITVAGASVVYFGLPRLPAKDAEELVGETAGPLIEFLQPFADMANRRSMTLLLISYTIYTDCTYAISSVTGQLFYAEIKPNTLEYTLYALAATVSGVIASIGFLLVRPHVPIRLETWLLIGYAIVLIQPAWGCVGFASVDFGFKARWEFYAQTFLIYLSGVIVNTTFRVMFSEMVPSRNEVRWFSLQYILSSSTVWINYVASAPLQNATHELRFPLVLSLVFVFFACVMEVCRQYVSFFKRDRERWLAYDQRVGYAEERDGGSHSEYASTEDDGDARHLVVLPAKM